MKNMKKFVAVMATASLVAASGITASALEYTGPEGTTTNQDGIDYGHTTFSIVESTLDPTNVSFTVPLFVTMAVVDGSTDVKVPSNYEITNTSKGSGTGVDAIPALDIAVTAMTFEKLATSTYNTVASGGGAKDIALSIGGLMMPALNSVGTVAVDVTSGANAFFNGTDKYTQIAADESINLPLVATLGAAPEDLDNAKAVPQFKVKYVVSAVDAATGNLLPVYAGDDKNAAGLGFLAE